MPRSAEEFVPYQRYCEQLAAEAALAAAAAAEAERTYAQFQRVVFREREYFVLWHDADSEDIVLIEIDKKFDRICAPKEDVEPQPFDAIAAKKFFTTMSNHSAIDNSIFAANVPVRFSKSHEHDLWLLFHSFILLTQFLFVFADHAQGANTAAADDTSARSAAVPNSPDSASSCSWGSADIANLSNSELQKMLKRSVRKIQEHKKQNKTMLDSINKMSFSTQVAVQTTQTAVQTTQTAVQTTQAAVETTQQVEAHSAEDRKRHAEQMAAQLETTQQVEAHSAEDRKRHAEQIAAQLETTQQVEAHSAEDRKRHAEQIAAQLAAAAANRQREDERRERHAEQMAAQLAAAAANRQREDERRERRDAEAAAERQQAVAVIRQLVQQAVVVNPPMEAQAAGNNHGGNGGEEGKSLTCVALIQSHAFFVILLPLTTSLISFFQCRSHLDCSSTPFYRTL